MKYGVAFGVTIVCLFKSRSVCKYVCTYEIYVCMYEYVGRYEWICVYVCACERNYICCDVY